MSGSDEDKARLDRWLCAVRIFRTRTLAAEACKAGRVRLDGQFVKPSRQIAAGDEIEVRKGPVRHRFRVLRTLEKRVAARLVPDYLEDLTPDEEFDQARAARAMTSAFRMPGKGRPTKKDRRRIDRWRDAEPGDG